jgi:hypothetical protein
MIDELVKDEETDVATDEDVMFAAYAMLHALTEEATS